MQGIAYTTNDGIHISEEWVTKNPPNNPNDYGMVVHELTHVVQDYKGGDGWLTEGIADYVRHKYFEKDIDKLAHQINPDNSSYKQAYTTAAAFLFWLEEKKDKDLVRKLNAASHDGTYKVESFKQLCGTDVDALWKSLTPLRGTPTAGNRAFAFCLCACHTKSYNVFRGDALSLVPGKFCR